MNTLHNGFGPELGSPGATAASVTAAIGGMSTAQATASRTALGAAAQADLAALSDPSLSAGPVSVYDVVPTLTQLNTVRHGQPRSTSTSAGGNGSMARRATGSSYSFNAVQFRLWTDATVPTVVKVRVRKGTTIGTVYSQAIAAEKVLNPSNLQPYNSHLITAIFDSSISVAADEHVWCEWVSNQSCRTTGGYDTVLYNDSDWVPYYTTTKTYPDPLNIANTMALSYAAFAIGTATAAVAKLQDRGPAEASEVMTPVVLLPAEICCSDVAQFSLYHHTIPNLDYDRGKIWVQHRTNPTTPLAYEECLRIEAPAADVTDTVIVRSLGYNRKVASKDITIKYGAKGSGGGTARKLNVIASSEWWWDDSSEPAEVARLLSGSKIALTWVGKTSRTGTDSASGSQSVKDSAVSSMTYSSCIADAAHNYSAAGTTIGDWSLQYHLATHCGGATMAANDWVFLFLGLVAGFDGILQPTNSGDEICQEWPDKTVEGNMECIEGLITQIQSFTHGIPGIRVAVGTLPPTNPNRSHWGRFGNSTRYDLWRHYSYRFNKRVIEKFDGRTASGIYVLPRHCWVDPEWSNYPQSTAVARHAYATGTTAYRGDSSAGSYYHCAKPGNYQQAAAIAAFLLRHA